MFCENGELVGLAREELDREELDRGGEYTALARVCTGPDAGTRPSCACVKGALGSK